MIKAVIFDLYETLITHYTTPLYFGTQIAEDAGMQAEDFLPLWRSTDYERSIGKVTLEAVLEEIFRKQRCYSKELVDRVVEKRQEKARVLYEHLHPEIIPMLEGLRQQGVLIGMISNCYPEEAKALRESVLAPYFDVLCLSCELGVAKPEKAIFDTCLEWLASKGAERQTDMQETEGFRIGQMLQSVTSLKPGECLYVGDGGSNELETAREFGMQTMQAVWYLQEGSSQPAKRKPDFRQAESPVDIAKHL